MNPRYVDYHLAGLKSSAMVCLPIRQMRVAGKGQHWAEIAFYVLGLHDLRARQGTFTNPWSATSNPVFAAPELYYVQDKLSDLLDRRATELLAQDRRIAVMWSGGIDSTCVLSALIKNTNDLEQIVIYHSAKSVEENPHFYQEFIEGKIECRETATLNVTDEFVKSHIVAHGDPGDCLFGPSMPMYEYLLADKQHLLPWRNNRRLIAQGIVNKGASQSFADWYTDKVSANIEEVGIEGINTISDWWWWHYYNLKWEFSMLRPFFDTRDSKGRKSIAQSTLVQYNADTFYNTDYFQSWSYSNLDRLCADPKRHKQEPKSYIYDLDKNMDYFENKRKSESIAGDPMKRPAYLDKDLKQYYMHDPGVREAITILLEQFKG